MIGSNELAVAYGRNIEIIKMQTEGLTHADSVLQPPVRGNCMNWVLGHIAQHRSSLLVSLGLDPILSDAEGARYVRGSEPVTEDGDDILELSDMLERLAVSQERLSAFLDSCDDAAMERQVHSFMGETTASELLFFLYFHETYHTGQTELLRQLAGTDDAII